MSAVNRCLGPRGTEKRDVMLNVIGSNQRVKPGYIISFEVNGLGESYELQEDRSWMPLSDHTTIVELSSDVAPEPLREAILSAITDGKGHDVFAFFHEGMQLIGSSGGHTF